MALNDSPLPRRSVRWRNLRRSQKLCVVGLALLLLVLGLEGVARLYWWRVKGLTNISPEAIWRTTYTEVADSGIDRVAAYHGDKTFDVLLLGASVLHPSCGDVALRLQQRLEQKLGRSVRVVNLAYPGRTSVESRMKYAHLADRRFDLVLFYEAINDTYLNNFPPGEFRADYSHARHIAQMQALKHHPEVSWFCLPYTIRYLFPQLGRGWRLTACHWDLRYGADLRTPPSYEANLEAVARIAAERGDPLMLATFAYYIPANYSRAAFQAHRLDYASHFAPVEAWGEPANVLRGLEAHNAAVRRVAARHKTMFVDVAGQIPAGRLCFNDPCHLTPEGCRRFVELIVGALPPTLH
jgi:GDSL-like lipase/acylhydrolase family protein